MKRWSVVVFLLGHFGLFAQPGVLDNSFSSDGIIVLPGFSDNTYVSEVRWTQNGKVLCAGTSRNGNNTNIFLVRLLESGEMDMSFGISGSIQTSFGFEQASCKGMELQADGKIVLIGSVNQNGNESSMVVRLNSDGGMDHPFGTGGILVLDIGYSLESFLDLQLLPNGNIICLGRVHSVSPQLSLIRVDIDGNVDVAFGNNGQVISSISQDHILPYSCAVDYGGSILVSGARITNGGAKPIVLKYSQDGVLDEGFGDGGVLFSDFATYNNDFQDIAINVDGSYLVVGESADSGGGQGDILIARFYSNGEIDSSFSEDGYFKLDLFGFPDAAQQLLIQQDNKVLVGGTTISQVGSEYPEQFALARLNPDGSLDNSFGIGGYIATGFVLNGQWAGLESMNFQADGKILAAGYVNNGQVNPVVARFISGINIGIGEVDTYIGSTLVYPNPITNNQIRVEYELKADETVSIDLFDLTGKLISQLQSSVDEKAGPYQKTLSLPNVSAGNYLLKLNTEKGSVSVKLTVN